MAYRLASEVADPSRLLVVERGPRFSPLQDFNDTEMEMVRKLYKEGGLQQTKRFDLVVLQGECVGGSTVINNAICLRMPPSIRQLWENEYGLKLSALFDADGLTSSASLVHTRASVRSWRSVRFPRWPSTNASKRRSGEG